MTRLSAVVLILALAIVTLPATSASAQMGQMGGGRHRDTGAQKDAPKTPKVDEKAYNAALKRIPDSKEKFDPWGSVGVPSSEKKPK